MHLSESMDITVHRRVNNLNLNLFIIIINAKSNININHINIINPENYLVKSVVLHKCNVM